MNKKLARVERASLDIKEREILNFWIHVKYEEGLNQGVGGIILDTYNDITKMREGTAFGCEIIRRLLLVFNVNDFSEMKGKHIWVLGTGEGFNFEPKGIERLRLDWEHSHLDYYNRVIFDEVYKELNETSRN